MAGGIIERLLIAVGLDTNDVDKGLSNLEGTMKSGFKNIMQTAIAPALSMLGAFSAGDLIAQIGEEALNVKRYADLLGMSTEQMSAWASVADNFGIEAGDLADVLTDVNDKVTDLVNNDAGPFKELVEQGLIESFQNADGTLKSTEQIIYELSDAVKSLGGQAGAGLLKRLGFNDPRMLTMLMQGGDALKNLVGAEKLKGGFSDEDAEAALEFTTTIKDLARSLKRLLLPAFRLLAPVISAAAKGVSFLTEHATALIPVLAAVAAVMTAQLIPAAKKTGAEIAKAFSWKKLGLLAALVAIGLVLDDFVTWLNGGEAAFGDFYDTLFGGVDGAKAFIDELIEFGKVAGIVAGVIAAFTGLAQILSIVSAAVGVAGAAALGTFALVAAAVAAVAAAVYLIYENWDTICNKCAELWGAFSERVAAAWNNAVAGIVDATQGIWESIAGVVNAIISAWLTMARALLAAWKFEINAIAAAFSAIVNVLTVFWEGFVETFTNAAEAAAAFLNATWTGAVDFFVNIFAGAASTLMTLWEGFVALFTSTTGAAAETISGIWTGITAAFSELWGGAIAGISAMWEGFVNLFSEIWTAATGGASAAWETFTNSILSAWETVTSPIDSWIGGFLSKLAGAWESVKNIGKAASNIDISQSYGIAAGAGGNTSNNMTATQNNNISLYGNVSRDQLDNMTSSLNAGYMDIASYNGA